MRDENYKNKFKSKLKKLNKPSIIIIHHAAHSSANVDEIHRWHLENGWCESYYHFLVTKDGTIHKGRLRNSIRAHTKSYNSI